MKVDSELNVDSRPFHWCRDFAWWYLGRSHSAEKHVRILLAMETFKSLHTQDKGERLQRQKACSATCLRISMCELMPTTTCSQFLPDYMSVKLEGPCQGWLLPLSSYVIMFVMMCVAGVGFLPNSLASCIERSRPLHIHGVPYSCTTNRSSSCFLG